ncbi:MAG TPA: hypothetical protein VD866_28865 [Urbifossiella sp.]|nr:hypothetical protein [Urbifossiella sp.]
MSNSARLISPRDARADYPQTSRVILLAALVTFGVVGGFAPLLCYLLFADPGRIPWALLVLGVVTWPLAAGIIGRRPEALGRGPSSPREVVAAALSALLWPATSSFVLLLFRLLVYGVWYCLWWVLTHWLGVGNLVEAATVAWWAIAGLAFLYYFVGISEVCRQLPGDLYPNVVGMRSYFYDRVARSGWGWLWPRVAAGVVVLILCLLIQNQPEVWSFLWALYLLIVPIGLTRRLGERRGPWARAKAVEAVAKLLASAGYETVTRPQADTGEIDPLLVRVDLLARTGQESLVAAVLTEAVEFGEFQDAAQRVSAAAYALKKTGSDTLAGMYCWPVVYYFGSDPRYVPDAIRWAFPPVALVRVDPAVIEKADATADPKVLQEIARPLHEFARPAAEGPGSVPA